METVEIGGILPGQGVRTMTKKGICIEGRYYYFKGMAMWTGSVGVVVVSPTDDGKLFFRLEKGQFELMPVERPSELVGKHFPVDQRTINNNA